MQRAAALNQAHLSRPEVSRVLEEATTLSALDPVAAKPDSEMDTD
jgi:hypothetical protein